MEEQQRHGGLVPMGPHLARPEPVSQDVPAEPPPDPLADLATAAQTSRYARRGPPRRTAISPATSASLALVGLAAIALLGWAIHAAQEQAAFNSAPVVVTPERLKANYETNEVAADEVYKGRLLEIRGEVAMVGRDGFNRARIVFSPVSILHSVTCVFDGSHEGEIASIRRGDVVTIRGIGAGMYGPISVEKCRVIDAPER